MTDKLTIWIALFLTIWCFVACSEKRKNFLNHNGYTITINDEGNLIATNSDGKQIIDVRLRDDSIKILCFDEDCDLKGFLSCPTDITSGGGVFAIIKTKETKDRKGEIHYLIESSYYDGPKENSVIWGRVIHLSDSTAKPKIGEELDAALQKIE